MEGYMIDDIFRATDRYKLYVLPVSASQLQPAITRLEAVGVPVLDIGREMARYLTDLQDTTYLSIDAHDQVKNLFEERKAKITDRGNELLAIHNLGILLEPALELNAAQLLKAFAKSAALILIWEHQIVEDRLCWPTRPGEYALDFSDATFKKLPYAI
jgi:hypothetical protein